MPKYVVYAEMTEDGQGMIARIPVEEAIRVQKENTFKSHGFLYKNDEEALDDFACNNWGTLEED